jgi:hypothetical protein
MQTYHLVRDIPVEEGYDLVVAGAGPAGCAAAISAGRLGAKVLLVEPMGCLGGMATSGLVTAFDPMANGEVMMVGGVMREIVETMYTRGFIAPGVPADYWRKLDHHWTPFDPEGLKLLLDELTAAAGVEVRLFTRVIDADVNAGSKHVNGVVLQNVEGYRFIAARTFVDATGDAVLTDLCGAPYREAGRDTPRIMPPTLCSLFTGIDWNQHGKLVDHLRGEEEAKDRAIAAGFFSQNDRLLPGMWKTGKQVGYLNANHIFNTNAVKCSDLTNAMIVGRRLVQEYTRFYREFIPGCENIELVTTAALLGVRESRRIVGEYELNISDYLGKRQFPDQIGVFNKYVDVHCYDTTPEEYERFKREKFSTFRLKEGECFGIPYGILVPRGWDNLWVAGRCNSSDVEVHGSIRVQPACAMMGQAVGAAAVQSMRTGQPACDLDTRALVETLRANDAYLPQTELSTAMTRGQVR